MKVEARRTDALIPYVNNARTHSDAQIAKIAASIKEFGFNNPILVDGESGVIAGHGRLLAARKLGLEKVPVIELAHLSETQRKAYILADNRMALDAGWDSQLLTLELSELQEAGYDAALTGFSAEEIERLLTEPDEEDIGADGDESRGVTDELLKFGGHAIPLTDEELAVLNERLEGHIDAFGVKHGFVTTLLGLRDA